MLLNAYLVLEGTTAVGVMALVFGVAFAGVIGLGAYVIYCDVQNRRTDDDVAPAAEADTNSPILAGAHAHAEAPLAEHGGPAGEHSETLQSAPGHQLGAPTDAARGARRPRPPRPPAS